jgi:hypothetical protein
MKPMPAPMTTSGSAICQEAMDRPYPSDSQALKLDFVGVALVTLGLLMLLSSMPWNR